MTFRNRADAAWNVFRQDEGGKEPVPVTRFTDGRLTAHAWSPDGTRLAVVRRTARAATCGSPGPTAAAPRRSRSCRRPTSSPCAGCPRTKLLVGQLEADPNGLQRTVWTAFAVPGAAPLATFRLPASAIDPTWSPDGQGLTFRKRDDPAWNVHRQDANAQGPAQLTRFTQGRLLAHAWSPDGTKIAVIHRTAGGANVWVTVADGSRPAQVTQLSDMDVFLVRWLPDSRRLAVQAGKLSRDVVLIRSFR